jgi:hypothetical protein
LLNILVHLVSVHCELLWGNCHNSTLPSDPFSKLNYQSFNSSGLFSSFCPMCWKQWWHDLYFEFSELIFCFLSARSLCTPSSALLVCISFFECVYLLTCIHGSHVCINWWTSEVSVAPLQSESTYVMVNYLKSFHLTVASFDVLLPSASPFWVVKSAKDLLPIMN